MKRGDWVSFTNYKRALQPALVVLNKTCNLLELPSQVRVNALSLFKQCYARRLSQGREREALINACILISCELLDYPIKIKSLLNELSKRELFSNKSFIRKHLGLPYCEVNPCSYVSKYCSELGLSESVKTIAFKKISEVGSSELRAVTAIYLVSDVSIRKLASLSGLSKNSIWRAIRKVKK